MNALNKCRHRKLCAGVVFIFVLLASARAIDFFAGAPTMEDYHLPMFATAVGGIFIAMIFVTLTRLLPILAKRANEVLEIFN